MTRESAQDIDGIERVDDNTPIRPQDAQVGVLDAILNDPNLGKPIQGTWYCKRLNIKVPIRSLDSAEWAKCNEDSRRLERLGKTRDVHETTDLARYQASVIALGCVSPDFNNPDTRRQLAERSGQPMRNSFREVINLVFKPGEVSDMTTAIAKLSGFTDEDLVAPDEKTTANLKG